MVDQRHRATGSEADAHDHVETEDVEEREHAEPDVGRHEPQTRVVEHLADVRRQVAVGEHRRLRRPGGPGSEQQHGEVVVGPGHEVGGRVGQLDAIEPDTRDAGDTGVVSQQGQPRLDGPRLALELRRRCGRVQRDRHRTVAEHREVAHDELDGVGRQDRDPVVGLYALGLEHRRDTGDPVGEVTERHDRDPSTRPRTPRAGRCRRAPAPPVCSRPERAAARPGSRADCTGG